MDRNCDAIVTVFFLNIVFNVVAKLKNKIIYTHYMIIDSLCRIHTKPNLTKVKRNHD